MILILFCKIKKKYNVYVKKSIKNIMPKLKVNMKF